MDIYFFPSRIGSYVIACVNCAMRKMVLRRLIIEAGRPRGGTFHEPVKVSRVQRARGGIAPIPFTNRIFAEVGIVFPLVSLSCTTSRESSFIPFSLSAKRRFLDEDKNLERISFYRVYIYICISWRMICIKGGSVCCVFIYISRYDDRVPRY